LIQLIRLTAILPPKSQILSLPCRLTFLFVCKVIGIVDDSIDKNTMLLAKGIDSESPVDPRRRKRGSSAGVGI
jgi:hypothetical protein